MAQRPGTETSAEISPETSTESSNVVFEAKRVPPAPHTHEFAPFEDALEDDDSVYPVENAQPCILSLESSFRTRPFVVSGVIAKALASVSVDSGASSSFVSTAWCQRHNIVPKAVNYSGRLPNSETFSITGKLVKVPVKFHGFRVTWDLLVSDLPGLDVVLGLDFLEKYDPALKCKKREMHLVDPRPGIDATSYLQSPENHCLTSTPN